MSHRVRDAVAFLFPAETERWLAFLRIGLGAQVCLYCLALHHHWNFFLAGTGSGLLGRQISEALLAMETPLVPTLEWWIRGTATVGLSERTALLLFWLALLGTGIFLLLGWGGRATSVAAWLLHLSVAKSGGLLSYGVDNFMTIGLFYLMLAPPTKTFSIWPAPGRTRPPDPHLVGFFRRLLQVHLCLVYFFGGLTKALGRGWWDGTNIWRALIRPPFDVIPPEILVAGKVLLPLAGISIVLVEVAYPLMVSMRRTRPVWLLLVCAMHIGIGLTMGMYLFGLVMIVLNLAAFMRFAPPSEPEPAAVG